MRAIPRDARSLIVLWIFCHFCGAALGGFETNGVGSGGSARVGGVVGVQVDARVEAKSAPEAGAGVGDKAEEKVVVVTTTAGLPKGSNTTTAVPTTTPNPVECPSPPCPPNQNVFLQPQRGPNRNNQQMGQIVTISGVFFPEDCTKGCVFSPPCDACEMEVTHLIYFGTEDAGCNFYDSDATACMCTPLPGVGITGDCAWEGIAFASKYRCSSLTCQISPLFGTQPLKIFFRDKKCTKHDMTDCPIYPSRGGLIDPDAHMFQELNYTYDPPSIVAMLPDPLPAQGGLVTLRGENFGGDSNYIQVFVDHVSQGVTSNPRVVKTSANGELLEITVRMQPRVEGKANVQVFVGQGDDGETSKAYKASFKDVRSRAKILMILAGVITSTLVMLALLLSIWNVNNMRRNKPGAPRGLVHGEGIDHKSWRIDRENLLLTHKIARGAFGNVFKGSWLGTVCAIKQIDIYSLQDLKEFESEAALLSELHHPNIVQLLGVCRHNSLKGVPEMLLVMEYLEQGSLGEVLLNSDIDLCWYTRRQMALDAAKGMTYLHSLSPPVLHRDLKSPNLLVDGQNRVKIADFGLSRFRVEYTMTFCGSPKWTAPEVLNGDTYDTAADVWSYGVVVWELLSRMVPYGAGTWRASAGAGKTAHVQPGTSSPASRSRRGSPPSPMAVREQSPHGEVSPSELSATSVRSNNSSEPVNPSGSVRKAADGDGASSLREVKIEGSHGGSGRRVCHRTMIPTPELQGPQVAVRVAREGSLLILPQWEGPADQDRQVLEEIMRACLVFDPAGRPTFKRLVDSLCPLQESICSHSSHAK